MPDATSAKPPLHTRFGAPLTAALLVLGAGTGIALWEKVVAASAISIEKGWRDLSPTLGSSFEFVDYTPQELSKLGAAVPGEVLDVPWLTQAFLTDAFLATTRSVVTKSGVTVWKGVLEDCLFGDSILVASEAGAAGFFQRDNTVYCVEPLPGGKVVISKLFHHEMPRESDSVTPETALVARAASAALSAPPPSDAPDYPIEVLLLLSKTSPRAPSYCHAPTGDLVERLLEERLDDAFQRSFSPAWDCAVTFHVVLEEIDHQPEGGDLGADLTWLRKSPEVAGLRERFAADLVGFLVDDPVDPPEVGGVSTQLPETGPDPARGFMVIEVHCALANYCLEHEIGHCLGMHHDAGETGHAPFYGHMLRRNPSEPVLARTIMMGSQGQESAPRIPVFSHPESDLRGLSYGVEGNSSWTGGTGLEMFSEAPANNRLAILENAPAVSLYRSGHPPEQ